MFKMRKTFKQKHKELEELFDDLSYEFRNLRDDKKYASKKKTTI